MTTRKHLRDLKEMHDNIETIKVEITREEFNNLVNRIIKVEKDMEKIEKENDHLKTIVQTLNIENNRIVKVERNMEKLEKENNHLKEVVETLKFENLDLKKQMNEAQTSKEEGKISHLEDIKEEIQKVKEEVKHDMEVAQTGWVEIVKRNIKKEIKEDHIINTTLEEEKMRQARRLNVRVIGLKEGTSPEDDAKALGCMLGYIEPLPINKVWRVGKDLTRKRILILQFKDIESRITFFKKRPILRGLSGDPIFLDEDLTKMQIEHRKTCMPRVLQARKEGRRAFYRDGRVIIDGRTTE